MCLSHRNIEAAPGDGVWAVSCVVPLLDEVFSGVDWWRALTPVDKRTNAKGKNICLS